jgi:hypothetical protein
VEISDSVADGDDATNQSRNAGNPAAGVAGQVLIHPSYLCQIGASDQGLITSKMNSPEPHYSQGHWKFSTATK